MAVPNDLEKQLIAKFRESVGEILKNEEEKSDLFLVRWIRARDNNLDAAEAMIRKATQWREDKKIESLLASSPDQYFTKNFPYWLNGVDLNGRPVLCIPMCDWDIKKAVDDGKIEEFDNYFIRIFERVLEGIRNCNDRQGTPEKPITQFVCLVNWDGFSVRQTSNMKAIQSLLNACAVYESYYPEILGDCVFMNTNTVFQAFFMLMKPILAPKTLGKIKCHGTDRKDWEPVVRSIVEEHQIPRQFGG